MQQLLIIGHTLQLNDRTWVAYNSRDNAYKVKGAYDQAIRNYSKVIELKQDDPRAFINRGNANNGKGNYDLAIRDYTKAIELNPDYGDAYYNRAIEYYRLKAYDQAWADVSWWRQLGGSPHPDFLRKLSEALGRTE